MGDLEPIILQALNKLKASVGTSAIPAQLPGKGTYSLAATYAANDLVYFPLTDKVYRAKQALSAGQGYSAGNVSVVNTWTSDLGATVSSKASITVPSGQVQVGDLLIMEVERMSGTGIPALPGWTYITSNTNNQYFGALYYRYAAASDVSAGFTVTAGDNADYSWMVLRAFRGVDYFDPTELVNHVYASGAVYAMPSSANSANSVRKSTRDRLEVLFLNCYYGLASPRTITPTGWSNFTQTTGDYNFGATATVAVAAGGATAWTAGSFTVGTGTVYWGSTRLNLYAAAPALDPAYWEETVPVLYDDIPIAQFKGDYSAAKAYSFRDSIRYRGRAYEAVKDLPAGSHDYSGAPNPTYWVPSDYLTSLIGNADLQVFLTSGTWVKPSGATKVEVFAASGGGGGGGGYGQPFADSTTRLFGGAGGGGGALSTASFSAFSLPSSLPVTVGAGGAGGSGAVSTGTGATGGTSSFFNLSVLGGIGGANAGNTGGSGAAGNVANGVSAASMANANNPGAAGPLATNAQFGGAGGAGGGAGRFTSSYGTNPGGAGSDTFNNTAVGGAGGAAGSNAGNTGDNGFNGAAGGSKTGEWSSLTAGAGGGGGGSSAGVNTAGAGGAGGFPSGGGGGGGSNTNTSSGGSGGAGGKGGDGVVLVITYF